MSVGSNRAEHKRSHSHKADPGASAYLGQKLASVVGLRMMLAVSMDSRKDSISKQLHEAAGERLGTIGAQ